MVTTRRPRVDAEKQNPGPHRRDALRGEGHSDDSQSESSWRVRVLAPDGTTTHESSFDSLEMAQGYFEPLHVTGSQKIIEHRPAGKNRYVRIVLAAMGGFIP